MRRVKSHSPPNPLQKVSLFYFHIFFLDENLLSLTETHCLEPHGYKSTHDSLQLLAFGRFRARKTE